MTIQYAFKSPIAAVFLLLVSACAIEDFKEVSWKCKICVIDCSFARTSTVCEKKENRIDLDGVRDALWLALVRSVLATS